MQAVACRRAAHVLELDAEGRRLVETHVRLAEQLAYKRCRWGKEDPDDLRSDAFWGLMLAARAFDPDRGSFAAYAVVRIEGAIRRGRQIRSGLTRTLWERGDHPTPLSLNARAEDEGGAALMDFLAAPSQNEHDWLADAIRRLPARESMVLRLRYFHGLPQSRIAPMIGRSQMQVSRIERAGLAMLREVATAPA